MAVAPTSLPALPSSGRSRSRSRWLALLACSLLWACAQTTQPTIPQVAAPSTRPLSPEGASGLSAKPGWAFQRQAVAAANPLAAQAGLDMLRAGGSAIDAAVAVQMVLTLVEPQSSGIGGGAFLLHTAGGKVQAYDGRESAPAAVDERLFLTADGKPMAFYEAVVGGRSVGVPGAVAMLALAHRQHGVLPWARLFEPAIALAESGFAISPRLHALIAADPHLRRDPSAAAYFYDPSGQPWPVGHVLRNPALAEVLRALARQGPSALHEGPVAQAIVDKVRSHPSNPGTLSMADMAAYAPREREPLCQALVLKGRALKLCGMPPPSSGALAVGQILGILSTSPSWAQPAASGLPSAEALHIYAEASRLAFADRALYVADPDYTTPPAGRWDSLLDPGYLVERARLIGARRMAAAPAGEPGGTRSSAAPMAEQPEFGTSHISVIDAQGRAVAMTTTIEDAFGARQMVRGFLLNNELTDFSFAPADAQGKPVANRVQPGKRPRSSMSPTLVFDAKTGALLMSLGSPGGAQIIHYTTKTLLATLLWDWDVQRAIDLPNWASLGGPVLLEERRFPAATVQSLRDRGHEVREPAMTSGLQALQWQATGSALPGFGSASPWFGGADPRREGIVLAD
jgi:gamma-glutamyltranspeptidase/glutathione hydrolase